MTWWNWIIENIGDIWEVLVVVVGIAIYLAKKNKDGLLGEVWRDVRAKLLEVAKEALQEVSPEDVRAIAGPFWDAYLADVKILRFFINKERFLDFCWAQWQKFVKAEDGVERAVYRRKRVGSRAFNA